MTDDLDDLRPRRKAGRRTRARYRRWRRYLGDSRLTGDEAHRRAKDLARGGKEPPSE